MTETEIARLWEILYSAPWSLKFYPEANEESLNDIEQETFRNSFTKNYSGSNVKMHHNEANLELNLRDEKKCDVRVP